LGNENPTKSNWALPVKEMKCSREMVGNCDMSKCATITKEEFENLKREVFFSRYFNQNRFNLTEKQILIGRIMIFLCSTGLSFVDFDRLTINDLFVDKDNLDTKKKYLNIKIHRQKLNTTEVCIIPIIDITIDLLIDMLGLTYKFYEGDDSDVELSIKTKFLLKLK
jgi:hypothetical protein